MRLRQWQKCGDFMYFTALDNSNVGTLSIAYKFKDEPGEEWTKRFNDFKFGGGRARTAAIQGARATLSVAFQSIQLKAPVAVVTAISHADQTLSDASPLYALGTHLASSRQWDWAQSSLSKAPHRSLKEMKGSCSDRDAEVDGVYRAGRVSAQTVLILDDFTTRGSTIGDIARALTASNPSLTIYGVALGKAETVGYWAQQDIEINNAHVPRRLAEAWDKG